MGKVRGGGRGCQTEEIGGMIVISMILAPLILLLGIGICKLFIYLTG